MCASRVFLFLFYEHSRYSLDIGLTIVPMPDVVSAVNDPDLLTDLDIIALNEPGKGQAFKRIMERAGLNQRGLAEKLGYDPQSEAGRTTVSQWCQEVRWPSPQRLREALAACDIDRKILVDKFGLSLGTEVSPPAESRQLLVSLRNELMFEFDEFTRRDIIFINTAEKVLLFQAFKAFEDVRAAQLFFERFDKHQEEKQRRTLGNTRVVSAEQSQWGSGQGVYKESPETSRGSDTTTSSDAPRDNDKPQSHTTPKS